MKFAYADPPYLGLSVAFYGDHSEAAVYDTVEGHQSLIERLSCEFPDGWAYSLHSPALRTILPLCPPDVRVASWCKSWASFRPGVNPAYVWEPVIFRGGRSARDRGGASTPTVRDFLVARIAMRQGFKGAKPPEFSRWVFDLLGAAPDDELVDLFPGSGAVGRAWDTFTTHRRLT